MTNVTEVEILAARLEALLEKGANLAAAAEDPVKRQAVLAARARALAVPRADYDPNAAADALDVLVFSLGDEQLGVPLASIVAISRTAAVTPLPRAVAPVYGVTAWRGRPLTVLSLGASASPNADTRLVVLGGSRRAYVGLVVDGVDETLTLARSALSPAPSGPRRAMSLGMTSNALLVLDADALLNAARTES